MAAAGAVVAALVLGLVGTLIFAVGEGEQRGRAEQNARAAEQNARVAEQNARAAEQNARAAEKNARVAEEKKTAALYQAYRAHLAAAGAALQNYDVSDAARQLEEASKELRGWEWHHLHSRLDDSVAVLPIEANEAVQLARSPDGLRVVASTGPRVRLLDLEGHELLARSLPPGRGWILIDLLSGRRPRLVENVGDTIEVLDEEGRVQTRLKGVPQMKRGLGCLSADGSRLAMAWNNPTTAGGPNHRQIAVFEPTAQKQTPTRVDPGCHTWALAISPDGTRFASAGDDGVTRVWDSVTGALTAACRGHRSKVLSVAFRPDGQRLVTTSADGSVRQWDPATGQEAEPPYERHTGEVRAAAYSPDGRWVVSCGTDRTVRVWGAADRQEVAILHGHKGSVRNVAFSADGRQVVSVGAAVYGWPSSESDGTVRLWEALPGASLPAMHGHTSYVYPVAYSPDGQWIASGSWDHTVRLWDARTGEPCAPSLPARQCAGPGLQPRQFVVGLRVRRQGPAPGLGRRDRPAPAGGPGARKGRAGGRGEPGRGPDRGGGKGYGIRRYRGNEDRRQNRFLARGPRRDLEEGAGLQSGRATAGLHG